MLHLGHFRKPKTPFKTTDLGGPKTDPDRKFQNVAFWSFSETQNTIDNCRFRRPKKDGRQTDRQTEKKDTGSGDPSPKKSHKKIAIARGLASKKCSFFLAGTIQVRNRFRTWIFFLLWCCISFSDGVVGGQAPPHPPPTGFPTILMQY